MQIFATGGLKNRSRLTDGVLLLWTDLKKLRMTDRLGTKWTKKFKATVHLNDFSWPPMELSKGFLFLLPEKFFDDDQVWCCGAPKKDLKIKPRFIKVIENASQGHKIVGVIANKVWEILLCALLVHLWICSRDFTILGITYDRDNQKFALCQKNCQAHCWALRAENVLFIDLAHSIYPHEQLDKNLHLKPFIRKAFT